MVDFFFGFFFWQLLTIFNVSKNILGNSKYFSVYTVTYNTTTFNVYEKQMHFVHGLF